MNKVLVFDMDGTIANLYGVENWLESLRAFDPTPYRVAKPMYDMNELANILNTLKGEGWKVVITSWLSKDTTRAYDKEVRQAKVEWLNKYSFPYDEIHLVKYGTTKANCTRKLGGYQVLIDDNEQVRKGWNLGSTVNANEDIVEKLLEILANE
jgi:phosphoglycolate phosphatase-like HAD superfamily hydrolase